MCLHNSIIVKGDIRSNKDRFYFNIKNSYVIIFSIIINNLQIIRYSPYLYRRYIIFAVNQKKSSS